MTTTHHESIEADMHYLQLLAQSFPTIADASTEIINLEAIMALPKGTEHFLADLHGESGAFQHVLKNASGNIKRKVNELFGNDIRESKSVATFPRNTRVQRCVSHFPKTSPTSSKNYFMRVSLTTTRLPM